MAKALVADKLSVRLGATRVLQGVSIEVCYGHMTVIAGPNGAGKSTLLRALLGLVPASAGSVTCGDQPIDQMSRLERAQNIAYVPQRSLLDAALRVEEVVAQGRFAKRESKQSRKAAVAKAMQQAGIEALGHRSYLELSGGEQRLALIARALGTDAKIVCLDEPTACLDIANRLRTLALLKSLATSGRAILCVLHDLEDVRRFADELLLLHKGRVAAVGCPSTVLIPDEVRRVYEVELRANDALGFRLPSEVRS